MSESPASQPASSSGIAYTISTQYVKDFSFENPRAPMVFAQMAGKSPQVQVSVAVSGQQLSDSVYECILDIKAVAKNDEDVLFAAHLSYAGVLLYTVRIPIG